MFNDRVFVLVLLWLLVGCCAAMVPVCVSRVIGAVYQVVELCCTACAVVGRCSPLSWSRPVATVTVNTMHAER